MSELEQRIDDHVSREEEIYPADWIAELCGWEVKEVEMSDSTTPHAFQTEYDQHFYEAYFDGDEEIFPCESFDPVYNVEHALLMADAYVKKTKEIDFLDIHFRLYTKDSVSHGVNFSLCVAIMNAIMVMVVKINKQIQEPHNSSKEVHKCEHSENVSCMDCYDEMQPDFDGACGYDINDFGDR